MRIYQPTCKSSYSLLGCGSRKDHKTYQCEMGFFLSGGARMVHFLLLVGLLIYPINRMEDMSLVDELEFTYG